MHTGRQQNHKQGGRELWSGRPGSASLHTYTTDFCAQPCFVNNNGQQQCHQKSLLPPCHRARSQPATHPKKACYGRGIPWNSTSTTTHPSMDDVPGDWVRAIGPIYSHACLLCHAHCPYAPCASRVWTTPLSARAVFAGAQLPDRLGPHVQNPSGAHIIYAYVLAHYSCVLYTDCICTLSIPPTFPWQARASRCCSRWEADADANADVDADVDAVSPPPKTEKPPPPPQPSPPPGHRRATPSSSSAASPPPSSPPPPPQTTHSRHRHLQPPPPMPTPMPTPMPPSLTSGTLG